MNFLAKKAELRTEATSLINAYLAAGNTITKFKYKKPQVRTFDNYGKRNYQNNLARRRDYGGENYDAIISKPNTATY